MKKFTKLFLSCALVSAMAVTAAASAFAAPPSEDSYEITGGLKGTYTTSSNDITGLTVDGAAVTLEPNSQVTFLVYKKGANSTEVQAADVIGIDQGEAIQPVNNGLIANSVEEIEGKQNVYVVKVGYTPAGGRFTVATGEFTVGKALYLVGDANMNKDIAADDATTIIQHVVHIKDLTGDAYKAADANLNNDIAANDATSIIRYVVYLDDRETSPIGKAPGAVPNPAN